MKKILIFLLILSNIASISYFTFKDKNINQSKVTKEIVTSAPPKIIYKDKIIYKINPVDEKIEFQTKMFLHLLVSGQCKCTNVDFLENFDLENTQNGMDRALENKSYILNDITEYNKTHAGINDTN
jgi:hypothetical protein